MPLNKPSFSLPERGLISLDRGWRTPDPSPRIALPKCAAYEIIVNSEDTEVHLTSVRGRRSPSCNSESTTPRSHTLESCSFSINDSARTAHRFRTPSPEPAMHEHSYYDAAEQLPHQYVLLCVPYQAQQCVSPYADSQNLERRGRHGDQEEAASVIESGNAATKSEIPSSVGSLGHPFTCGLACKYVLKERGCKDGAMCERCHLCKWVKPAAIHDHSRNRKQMRASRYHRAQKTAKKEWASRTD